MDETPVPLAGRIGKLRSNAIRELLAITQRPDVISMAGGLTDRGSDRRVQIIRNKKQSDAKLTDTVQADDTIVVRQRLM